MIYLFILFSKIVIGHEIEFHFTNNSYFLQSGFMSSEALFTSTTDFSSENCSILECQSLENDECSKVIDEIKNCLDPNINERNLKKERLQKIILKTIIRMIFKENNKEFKTFFAENIHNTQKDPTQENILINFQILYKIKNNILFLYVFNLRYSISINLFSNSFIKVIFEYLYEKPDIFNPHIESLNLNSIEKDQTQKLVQQIIDPNKIHGDVMINETAIIYNTISSIPEYLTKYSEINDKFFNFTTIAEIEFMIKLDNEIRTEKLIIKANIKYCIPMDKLQIQIPESVQTASNDYVDPSALRIQNNNETFLGNLNNPEVYNYQNIFKIHDRLNNPGIYNILNESIYENNNATVQNTSNSIMFIPKMTTIFLTAEYSNFEIILPNGQILNGLSYENQFLVSARYYVPIRLSFFEFYYIVFAPQNK